MTTRKSKMLYVPHMILLLDGIDLDLGQMLSHMRFFRQECWSGLPLPPPGDFPNPGIEPISITSPALAGGFFTICVSATWDASLV